MFQSFYCLDNSFHLCGDISKNPDLLQCLGGAIKIGNLLKAYLQNTDLGTRGTNQRGTTFGARNLELKQLGHTVIGAQSL